MSKVNSFFERYPNSNEVFENGGKLFHDRGAADSYGKSETKKYIRESARATDTNASSDATITDTSTSATATNASSDATATETSASATDTNASSDATVTDTSAAETKSTTSKKS